MKYNYQISPHKKKKYLKKFYIITVGFFIFGAILAGLIRLDTYLQNKKNTPEQTTTGKTTGFIESNSKIFRTQYFQFQTTNSWTEIPDQTTGSKFVYHSYNGSLIEQIMTIYVGTIPKNLQSNRVLPVEINKGNRLSPSLISEHCNNVTGGPVVGEKEVLYESVTFICDADNTNYVVLVGLIGGTHRLDLGRPDMTTTDYAIEYRNVTALPDGSQFKEIMASFQTR